MTDERGDVLNLTDPAYGAKGDTVLAKRGGSITVASSVFSQSLHPFAYSDTGKVVTIQGAGHQGAVLTTSITAILNATTAILAHPALTTVSDAGHSFGTDDTPALMAAVGVASWWHTIYAPAGVYTILGASNSGDTNGGHQVHLVSRGGLVGQGGKFAPGVDDPTANTVFLCADGNAGFLFRGHARYEGFLVDGNNIATVPIQLGVTTGPNVLQPPAGESVPTGGIPTGLPTGTITGGGLSYGTFFDVWVTRSAGAGWTIHGAQNVTFYDCGATDNATDGVSLDAGTGGHDFFNFYERGSLRYGIQANNQYPTSAGFIYQTGDVQFFGGTLDSHPTRRGVSKIYNRAGLDWGFHDMTIVGDNLSGPTIDLDQTVGHSHIINGCHIWATPTGTNPGNACIQIGGTASDHRQFLFLKTDGCAFMSGDTSVYVTQNNAHFQYTARGWLRDDTKYGPAAVGPTDAEIGTPHATLPGPDILLIGRTGSWQHAELVAPWSGAVRYRIMGEGWVQVEGSVQSATGAPGTIFTLPLGYRPRTGDPLSFLVALSDASGAQAGVGKIAIQNGEPTNANAGAVSFAVVDGSNLTPGISVYLDGIKVPARSTTGAIW